MIGIAALIFINLLVVIFHTSTTVHIASFLTGEDFNSRGDVDAYLLATGRYNIAEWYGCPLCLGTWLAFFIGIVCTMSASIPLWFPIVFALSIPWVGYVVLRLIDKL